MSIQYQNNYPNVIIFAQNNFEGKLGAFILKQKYDNNLQNDQWEKNCWTYLNNINSLDFYLDKIKEHLNKEQETLIYMLNSSISSSNLIILEKWLKENNIKMIWIDHHSSNSFNSIPLNVWTNINPNISIPTSIKILNEIIVGEQSYSLEKESFPLKFFIDSLGNQLNDNENKFLVDNLNNLITDEEFLKDAIMVGKFIYSYQKNRKESNKEVITITDNYFRPT